MASDPYVVASWVCCVLAVTGFAVYSVVFTWLEKRRAASSDGGGGGDGQPTSAEDFVTARRSANLSQIAWSFYASSVGAWVIVTPANYAAFAGWVGMLFYALACGIPVIAIAHFGARLQGLFPACASLSDFCGARYGWATQLLVVLITVMNMAIVVIAEYTTIGSLFADFVGTVALPFIALVAVLTLSYTTYGGLHISIITDRVQAIFSVILVMALCIYVASTFRYELPTPLPPNLAANFYGYSAIMTMPLSLMGASVFSEALWQRVWASQDHRTLKLGSYIGCAAIIFVVFMCGMFGFLASWAGLIDENTNPNLYLFQIFKSEGEGSNATVSNWVGVVIMVLAVTMNESAIDSMQNGLAASIACRFFLKANLVWTRVMVVLINIPLVVIALLGLDVLSLFLITNMLTTCCMVPVLMGMYNGRGCEYITDAMPPLSFLVSFICVSIYGCSNVWDPSAVGQSIGAGIRLAWYGNSYAIDYFAVGLGTSIGAVLLWLGVRVACDKLFNVWKPTPVDWETLKATKHSADSDQDKYIAGSDASSDAGASPPMVNSTKAV